VVDKATSVRRLSISKNDDVMFEEEVSEGKWANSQIRNICGRLAGLTTRLTEEGSKFGQVLYGYLEINADVVYSIRFNTEKNFARLLVSAILVSTYEQIAGIMTLSVEPGTDWKSTRFPNLVDSFGFKIKAEPITKDDWARNRASYLEQAAAKIRAARSNTPSLGMGNRNGAIAPSINTFEVEAHQEPSPEEILQRKVRVKAKAVWGDQIKSKALEYSEKNLGGLKLDQLTIGQLEQYLEDLDAIA
jgi:hypothetical protein